VFDEYAVHRWGESKAVDEFFKDKNAALKSLPWTFSPTAYLKKEKL
jgi:peroxiredoxin